MKGILTSTAFIALACGMAQAGGVDRSGQSVGIIFEQGNYVELSYGRIMPDVSGSDLMGFGLQSVAGDHALPGLAMKYQFNDQLSLSLIYGQDYGADIYYPTALEGGSPLLGGTTAILDSDVFTGILRYKFDENWSAHGGIRASKASGHVTLAGGAYRTVGLDGYNVDFDDTWGSGYLIGAAYEIPDIALRVAITYFSKVEHDMDTTQRMGSFVLPLTDSTTIETPQAVNIDFQTGIAKDTLVFGSVRWVDWSEFLIQPTALGGASLTDLEDSTTWTLGIGRKFNENWSGSIFATYENGADGYISPLAPNNGYKGIGIGVAYTEGNMKVSLGARYLDIGDGTLGIGTPRTAVASANGNSAVAVGLKVGFSF